MPSGAISMLFNEFLEDALGPSIFDVVKIIWALLIHETMPIGMVDFLEC